MKLLLDTQLLLWTASGSSRLSARARLQIQRKENELFFSAASVWEVAIKRGLGRSDFQVDPRLLRRELLDNGYSELAVTGEHATAVVGLPSIHKDPFDRILVAQAMMESMTLLTTDPTVAKYPAPVLQV